MSCVNHIKSFLNVIVQKDHEKHKKFRSVFGGILFFIGFGGVSTWGNLNIYFFSYFHENNKSITPNQNNLILSIVGIPLLVITSFSIQIAEKIGFKKVISFFGIIYGISTIISSFCNDIYSFSLFYNIIPSWSIGFSLNPALYCVWANFPEIKGKISGYLFGVFQFSGIFYLILSTFIVNPRNLTANIQSEDGKYAYYGKDVTENVPKMIVFLGLFYFLFGFSGSYFIESPPIDHTHPASVELIKETLTDNAIELKKKTNYNQLNEENQIQINENPIIRTSECPDVKSGVKTRSFIIMFLSSQLVAMFSLYLFLNFKTYGLTIINNDRYITILYILNGIAGGFGRFFWGFLVDKYSFKKVIIVLECFVFLAGIIFPFVKNPVGYYIIICFIAFFDGGLISIIGPGLLLIYGLNIGAKLLTIKGLSFFFALITAPLIGYFLEGSFGIDKVFLVLGCLNIFGIIMCFFIKMKYSWEIK